MKVWENSLVVKPDHFQDKICCPHQMEWKPLLWFLNSVYKKNNNLVISRYIIGALTTSLRFQKYDVLILIVNHFIKLHCLNFAIILLSLSDFTYFLMVYHLATRPDYVASAMV